MSSNLSLGLFINCLARKISILYPNNCADKDDYIQAGYLKLAEIKDSSNGKKDLRAYAIVAISRAMRCVAIDAMCAVSAPHTIKKLVHRIEILLCGGKNESEICQELKIPRNTFIELKALIYAESWYDLFSEPTSTSEPFHVLDDILSSGDLTDNDKAFILAQFDDSTHKLDMNRKQRWSTAKSIRPRLTRSGYGI